MAVAVIVKAIGFSESERNAFSTVLDLSPSRLCTYRLWTPSTQREPDIFLFDGEASTVWNEVSTLSKSTSKPFLWVGHNPPRNAAHSFLRPVRWMSVMDALEVVASTIDLGSLSVGTGSSAGLPALGAGDVDIDLDLGGGGVDIDLDLGFGSDDGAVGAVGLPDLPSLDALPAAAAQTSATLTALPAVGATADDMPEPPTLMRTMLFGATTPKMPAGAISGTDTRGEAQPAATGGEKRALLVTNSRYERLFLRARLLKLGISAVDEVATGKAAMACAQAAGYDVAIVDIDTPGVEGWMLAQELRHAQHPVGSVIMTSAKRSAVQSVKARMAGLALVGGKPIDTPQLDRLLAKVAA